MDLSDKDPSENQNSPKWDRTSVSQAVARGTGWSLEGTEGPSCRKASHPAKGDTTMHGAGETESAKPPRPTGTRGRPATTLVRGGGRGARSLSSGASPRRPRPRTAAERGCAQGQSCLLRGRAPPLKESPEPSPAWVRCSFTKRVKNTRLSERHKLELPGTAVCCEGAGRPPSPRGDSGGTAGGPAAGLLRGLSEPARPPAPPSRTSAPRASCLSVSSHDLLRLRRHHQLLRARHASGDTFSNGGHGLPPTNPARAGPEPGCSCARACLTN